MVISHICWIMSSTLSSLCLLPISVSMSTGLLNVLYKQTKHLYVWRPDQCRGVISIVVCNVDTLEYYASVSFIYLQTQMYWFYSWSIQARLIGLCSLTRVVTDVVQQKCKDIYMHDINSITQSSWLFHNQFILLHGKDITSGKLLKRTLTKNQYLPKKAMNIYATSNCWQGRFC